MRSALPGSCASRSRGDRVGLFADDEEMSAAADHRRLRFQPARGVEKDRTAPLVRPALVEIGEHPTRPFDAEWIPDIEARIRDLRAQIFGAVEVRRREVLDLAGWIAMNSLCQIGVDDAAEFRIVEKAPAHSVE